MKSPKIFTICENCPADYLKAKKRGACKGSFLAICEGDKSYSKDPGIEPRQNWYLSMRRLSNLSPFGNLSHGVFFVVVIFFQA